MKIRKTYKAILSIIPQEKRKRLLAFFLKSILFGILDLLSIAYLIPILILFFDPQKLQSIINENTGFIIDVNNQGVSYFIVLALLFFIAKAIFQTRFNTALYVFLYDLSTDLSMLYTHNFINESYTDLQKENKGKVIQNIMTVPEDFCCRFLHSAIYLASEIIVLSVILTALLFLYFKITLLALVILCIFALFIFYLQKKQLTVIDSVYHKSRTKANNHLLNILDGFLEIKSTQNEQYFLEKFRSEKSLLNTVTARLVSYAANYSKYLEVCLMVCVASLALFSFQKGDAILLVSILGAAGIRLLPSISKILSSVTMIKSHFYTVGKLANIKASQSKTYTAIQFNAEIQLRNIDFAYKNNSILKACSLTIKKGSFIGIKGDSGIGKTTLLYLILGILKPQSGTYTIDGETVVNGDFLPFANYVPQQPFLFSGSIIENIVMGQAANGIDYDYIYFLCQKLELDSVIKKLENGYDTKIAHNSLRFSGGQKQRLALVRALYTKPELLILDETTNQQDKELEQKIFVFLKELTATMHTTIVSVSHNEEVAVFFDALFKIEQNKLQKA